MRLDELRRQVKNMKDRIGRKDEHYSGDSQEAVGELEHRVSVLESYR